MKIHLKNLHKGDIFYECEYGINLKCEVMEDPIEEKENNGWSALVKHSFSKEPTRYFQTTDESSQYLIKFYDQPEYLGEPK